MSILKVSGRKIVEGLRPLSLKGVNLGGWLMPEGYIMFAPNRPVKLFRKNFVKALGQEALEDLETAFRDNFVTEKDFELIKSFGFNCVRLPFHYGLVETKPYQYSKEGVGYLDRAIRWGKKRGIRIILDMHAAPGAQNHDWHSDSDGKAGFWTSPSGQKRAIALWQFLADRYKDEPVVAGYDLLNETVLEDPALLNKYYHALIKAIREVDRNHILFVEGNRWAQDIACLDDFADNNLVLSHHFYEPLEFTFHFMPKLRYPLVSKEARWDKALMKKRLEGVTRIAEKRGRPLYCGEFGIHTREGFHGEDKWLEDLLGHFRVMDVHWTYWTWKAVKNYIFPDGILSYLPNPPWVNRSGPEYGWETWHRHWPTQKKAMIASWRTEAFTENLEIVKVLHKAVKERGQ